MRILPTAVMCTALTLAGAAAAGDLVIVQQDKSFSEQKVVVRAGDRLLFRNQDSVAHNLFSRSPGYEFEVRVQLPGQDTSVSFDHPGAADVRCAIHPQMKLQVIVEKKE